jgi:hypothetical protein
LSVRSYSILIGSSALLSDKTGSLAIFRNFNRDETVREANKALIRPDQWFVLEVVAEGAHLRVSIDGETVNDWQDPESRFTEGFISLRAVLPGTRIKFRKILIKELGPQVASGESSGKSAEQKPQVGQPVPKVEPDLPPETSRARRSCIILWMAGGPSQLDTFDLKPGNPNGAPFREIETNTKGVRISEHLPLLAKQADRLAIIRSLSHNETEHDRACFLMHTGRSAGSGQGWPSFPSLGAVLAKELRDPRSDLPGYVLGGHTWPGTAPGFLGDEFAPLQIGTIDGRGDAVQVLDPNAFSRITKGRAAAMRQAMAEALDLSHEEAQLRDQYGRTDFGQQCLVARRLVERGVPVVELVLGGWDMHDNIFGFVKAQSQRLDSPFASLLKDLEDRKLLDSTLVLWMGEFGRRPALNAKAGRDHWSRGFSVVLAGAGIKGGQVIGRTSPDGMTVTQRPVSPAELHATVYRALGIDPAKENRASDGTLVPLVDKGTQPVKEALTAAVQKPEAMNDPKPQGGGLPAYFYCAT